MKNDFNENSLSIKKYNISFRDDNIIAPYYLKDYTANITTTDSYQSYRQNNSMIEKVAQWFLNKSAMSNKKLQKLCYYAYCWYIVFFNDLEDFTPNNENGMQILFSERFQAWLHGPVCPSLYKYYKNYGWREIPQSKIKPSFSEDIEILLQQVWDAYGTFSADELESLSHSEYPWQNARVGVSSGEACCNIISKYDILQYYSKLV